MPTTDHTLEIRDAAEFTLSWSGWGAETATEKRKAIKLKLDQYSFGVSPAPLDYARIKNSIGSKADPDEVDANIFMDGIILVRVFFDGTANTGEIKQGEPVCFDTVTGDAVTGIHEDWASDEYKVVGQALKDFSESISTGTYRYIPIKIGVAVPEAVLYGGCAKTTTSITAAADGASDPGSGTADLFQRGESVAYEEDVIIYNSTTETIDTDTWIQFKIDKFGDRWVDVTDCPA